MGKARIFGLVSGTVLALLVVAAVSASAAEFTAAKYPVKLTGAKDSTFTNELKTTTGVSKCPEPKYSATVTGVTTTVTVQPEYPDEGCTAFGFPATIDDDDCQYLFHIDAAGVGDVDLICTAGKELTITVNSATSKCIVHFPPQNDIGGTVDYTNIANGDITLEVSLTGIDYTHTKGSGVGACPAGSANNGTYVAKAIISGEEDNGSGAAIDILKS